MSTPRPMREIVVEMESLVREAPESAHWRADQLLLEAIERLAPYADDGDEKRLIDGFLRVTRWYA